MCGAFTSGASRDRGGGFTGIRPSGLCVFGVPYASTCEATWPLSDVQPLI